MDLFKAEGLITEQYNKGLEARGGGWGKHSLEHISSVDYGSVMMRRQAIWFGVREIEAVANNGVIKKGKRPELDSAKLQKLPLSL